MTVNEISFFTPLLAIVFGLLSFAWPCCLPLLPAYLGMIAGSSGTAGAADFRRGVLLWNGLGFVAGLAADHALGWERRREAPEPHGAPVMRLTTRHRRSRSPTLAPHAPAPWTISTRMACRW
jgi:hypothetical protein